jgi:hypothetical protein
MLQIEEELPKFTRSSYPNKCTEMTAKMDVTKSRMMSADDTGKRAAAYSPIRRRAFGKGPVGLILAEESRQAGQAYRRPRCPREWNCKRMAQARDPSKG